MSITVPTGPGQETVIAIETLKKPVWVRVSRNGSQLVLGKAHTNSECQYLKGWQHSFVKRDAEVVAVRGPILKHLCWCQLCLDPKATNAKKQTARRDYLA